jgi:hypothetical protein
LDKVVFNTEAHAFPRFELGNQFFTGWRRKQRDRDGNIIGEKPPLYKAPDPVDPVPAEEIAETKYMDQPEKKVPGKMDPLVEAAMGL